MKNKLTASFDDLLQNHYGRPRHAPVSNDVKVATLLANYYGKPPLRHHRQPHINMPTPTMALSLSHDDGEVLPTRAVENRFRGNVAPHPIADVPFEEYVVEGMALSRPSSIDAGRDFGSADDRSVREEYVVDIVQPLKETHGADLRTDAVLPLPAATSPAMPRVEATAGADAHDAPISGAKTTEDDFIKDMQAILSGQKAFDIRTKSTVPVDQLGQAPGAPVAAAPAIGPNTSDAIFAKLAQSMQYANAYDIGTVELENRFADFDTIGEMRNKAEAEKKARNSTPSAAVATPGPTVGSAEFIQDLDEIHRQQVAAARPVETLPAAPPAARSAGLTARNASTAGISTAQSMAPGLSQPLYDTGEHVLTGGNYYVDQLRVGPNPGVPFSYGQIIAMADLFEDVDKMMDASLDELGKLKTLIASSAAYYAGNKTDRSKDVSNKKWNDTTNKRYMGLAEKNSAHFSPNFLYPKAVFAGVAIGRENNKTMWETYHLRAIKEAQAIGAAPAGNSSPLLPLEGPLITNAFGDHFLTDAFSAGHLINKDAIVEFWKIQFFKGRDLLPEGKAFFKKLAAAAWNLGDVRKKFSELEAVEKWHHLFHPDINSADRFALVLEGVAEAEPDRIANMVVKAIHDRLNKDGVEVFNTAGDGTWRLTGDGTMNAENRQIMQKAVAQSIANINDPSIMVSNLDYAAYLAKVWKHVPQLTPASQQSVQRVVRQYVDPDSAVMVQAGADLIKDPDNLEFLVQALKDAKALQPA